MKKSDIKNLDEFIEYEKDDFLKSIEEFRKWYLSQHDKEEYPVETNDIVEFEYGSFWGSIEPTLAEFRCSIYRNDDNE